MQNYFSGYVWVYLEKGAVCLWWVSTCVWFFHIISASRFCTPTADLSLFLFLIFSDVDVWKIREGRWPPVSQQNVSFYNQATYYLVLILNMLFLLNVVDKSYELLVFWEKVQVLLNLFNIATRKMSYNLKRLNILSCWIWKGDNTVTLKWKCFCFFYFTVVVVSRYLTKTKVVFVWRISSQASCYSEEGLFRS